MIQIPDNDDLSLLNEALRAKPVLGRDGKIPEDPLTPPVDLFSKPIGKVGELFLASNENDEPVLMMTTNLEHLESMFDFWREHPHGLL